MEDAKKWCLADEELRKNLPSGVKLVRTLRGHTGPIGRIAWSPDGRILASPSNDKTIRLWDIETGECLRTIETDFYEIGPRVWQSELHCVAFDPESRIVAFPNAEHIVQLLEIDSGKICRNFYWKGSKIWSISISPDGNKLGIAGNESPTAIYNLHSGELICRLKKQDYSTYIAFDPSGKLIVSVGEVIIDDSNRHDDDPEESYWYVGGEEDIKLWDPSAGTLVRSMEGHKSDISHVAFNPMGQTIASASRDKTIKLWELNSGRLLYTFEGHTDTATCVSFIENGQLLASKSVDGFVRIWSTNNGDCVATINDPIPKNFSHGLAFHPKLPLLANVGSDPSTIESNEGNVIHIYELDLDVLLSHFATRKVTYASAKIVLVGDSGVGKTGLGWRLVHGNFKEHSSTHGQHSWLLGQLCKQRSDGTQCEAILLDLAGQPDYRLTHALFFNDVDLALLLFDPTSYDYPLNGVEYWLKQLKIEAKPGVTPAILIAARSDLGTPWITSEEINTFCKQWGIKAYLSTSAKFGEGIEELVKQMQNLIPWDDKPATVTTETFKRIKDFVLNLKEKNRSRKIILTPKELRKRLEKTDSKWKFSDDEMVTAILLLENYGYVKLLVTSQGEPRVLLTPDEFLNKLAASFVLEARRNQKGFGSLEEQQLLSNEYRFPELEKLTKAEKDLLLSSTIDLFLKHNVCFRETDQLSGCAYLVFPSLINLKKPLPKDCFQIDDDVVYTVSGAVENVYASLVVLMGYTPYFTRINQWQNHARYKTRDGFVCGFRLEDELAGELDFVLYFSIDTPDRVRGLFKSLFENFLAREDLMIHRREHEKYQKEHTLDCIVARREIPNGAEVTFYNDCETTMMLPKFDKSIDLTDKEEEEFITNRQGATQRSRFEQAIFRLKSYVRDQEIVSPECFISYAWGDTKQEQWVEDCLATDLQKAGINVIFDKWHNPPGSSIGRFIDRMEKADIIIVVGTSAYRQKYNNEDPEAGTGVAAECEYINTRMRGPEKKKGTIIPLLLEGTGKNSFPPCLYDRIFFDFSEHKEYVSTALELLLKLYQIEPNNPVAKKLRKLLVDSKEL